MQPRRAPLRGSNRPPRADTHAPSSFLKALKLTPDPLLNIWNCALNVVWLHLAVKSAEFALLSSGVRDPYYPPRPKWRAALDLCMNSRLLRMGSVGLDTMAGAPNATVGDVDAAEDGGALGLTGVPKPNGAANGAANGSANGHANGANAANGTAKRRGRKLERTPYEVARGLPALERHEPRVGARPATRLGAMARHAAYFVFFYTVLDAAFSLIRQMAPDTLAHGAVGGESALKRFLDTTRIELLPRAGLGIVVPRVVVAFCVLSCVASAVYWGISVCYHGAAVAFLALGWEISAWDVDVFDQPWKAESVIDLWGRRWHQLFRHQFIVLSSVTARALCLPASPLVLFPLSFLYSGLLHSLGSLAMDPIAAPLPLGSFFVASSFACIAEVVWKHRTGYRVRGPLGRIWAWGFLFATSRLAGDAWLDAGIAGQYAVPPLAGPKIADWLLTYAFAPAA